MPASYSRKLILGAWFGRQSGVPTAFVESAYASIPNLKIVIFCNRISTEAENYFKNMNVSMVPFNTVKLWHGPLHTYRFVLFARYASQHSSQFDCIMTTDVRDVVFQRDPFAELRTGDVHFFLERDEDTLKSNRHYAKWMTRFVDSRRRLQCEEETPTCCGVIAGGSEEMAKYLSILSHHIQRLGLTRRHKFGADSALHNLICHVTKEVPGVLVENNRLVANMGTEPDDQYVVDSAGVIRLHNGHAPAVCHQYERRAEIRSAIFGRYGGD